MESYQCNICKEKYDTAEQVEQCAFNCIVGLYGDIFTCGEDEYYCSICENDYVSSEQAKTCMFECFELWHGYKAIKIIKRRPKDKSTPLLDFCTN